LNVVSIQFFFVFALKVRKVNNDKDGKKKSYKCCRIMQKKKEKESLWVDPFTLFLLL